jgi:BirA family biotin operon repressor/biotin-[acetyl-CoA-carboxylase] ligase
VDRNPATPRPAEAGVASASPESARARAAEGGDLDAAAIARAAGLPERAVRVLDTVDSTSRVLMEEPWPASPASPVVLVARRQTAGRGRLGRVWLSGGDDSLTMSVALELPLPLVAGRLGALSVVAGLAVAEALVGTVPDLRLKWPNDLQRAGRKVAGLLCESRLQGERVRVVAGLGLNLLPAPDRFDAIGQPVGALFDSASQRPPRSRLAGQLAAALVAAIAGDQRASGSLPQRWACFDALAGRAVDIIVGGEIRGGGLACGVDEGGALRLLTAAGEQSIGIGEVSVRPTDPGGASR